MFVHGLGASSRYWRLLAKATTGYAGTAPDLLGFGRSPKPAHAAYDVEEHLDHLEPVVPRGAVVVGHSAGAIVAAALARRRPDLRGLLLLGVPAYPDPSTARREIGRLGWLARGTVNGSRLARAACWAMCELRPLLVPLAPRLVRDIPQEVAGDFLRHTWPSYSRTLVEVVVEHSVLPDLLAAARPVALLTGGEDRSAPPSYAHRLAANLTAGGVAVTSAVVPGGDHHLALREVGEVASALTSLVGAPPGHLEAGGDFV